MKAPDLTNLAIDWLSSEHPDSVIVTEMSVADWGGARIDVAAITVDEIVGVEIKGEGDSPSRLELQGLTYGQVARKMWLLTTPAGTLGERCDKKRPKGWGRLDLHSGAVRPRNSALKLGPMVTDKWGGMSQRMEPDPDAYEFRAPRDSRMFNPWAMCGTLWRDELYDIARLNNIKMTSKALVGVLTEEICKQMPVTVLHDAMIDQLRRRVWRKPVIDLRGRRQPELSGL